MKFDIVIDNLPYMLSATWITIKITVLSFILGLLIAGFVGICRSYQIPKIWDRILNIYVEIFRGTPLLIQLFFLYYGLPSIGINIGSYTAAILGLALNSGAYMSEVVRASILSIDKGQEEAAFALGYTKFQSIAFIILPQAFRVALPTLMNSFSSLLKESSLVSVLAITELTRSGQLIYTRTSRPFEIYLTLGVFYFMMTYSVSIISRAIEKKQNKKYAK